MAKKELYWDRKARGICVNCCHPKLETKTLCFRCNEKKKLDGAAWRRKQGTPIGRGKHKYTKTPRPKRARKVVDPVREKKIRFFLEKPRFASEIKEEFHKQTPRTLFLQLRNAGFPVVCWRIRITKQHRDVIYFFDNFVQRRMAYLKVKKTYPQSLFYTTSGRRKRCPLLNARQIKELEKIQECI